MFQNDNGLISSKEAAEILSQIQSGDFTKVKAKGRVSDAIYSEDFEVLVFTDESFGNAVKAVQNLGIEDDVSLMYAGEEAVIFSAPATEMEELVVKKKRTTLSDEDLF